MKRRESFGYETVRDEISSIYRGASISLADIEMLATLAPRHLPVDALAQLAAARSALRDSFHAFRGADARKVDEEIANIYGPRRVTS